MSTVLLSRGAVNSSGSKLYTWELSERQAERGCFWQDEETIAFVAHGESENQCGRKAARSITRLDAKTIREAEICKMCQLTVLSDGAAADDLVLSFCLRIRGFCRTNRATIILYPTRCRSDEGKKRRAGTCRPVIKYTERSFGTTRCCRTVFRRSFVPQDTHLTCSLKRSFLSGCLVFRDAWC